MLAEHRRAWASRWEDADVRIDGDEELQLAVRFAIFHLLANAPEEGEAAVGARGLTGDAYPGHVFWDTDVYVLPMLAATHPQAARAMLEYRVRRPAQVVKQADVLMLHYLVPDEAAPGSLAPNLDFYGPRTAHGSTLSPGMHAALLARAGRLAESLEMLRLTARIDLDDIGHMTAGGLHLAAMGSVWRTLAFGFAGLRPAGDALAIDPVIAPGWAALEIRVRFRASRVRVRIHPGAVEVSADPPLRALNPAGEHVRPTRNVQTFELSPTVPRRSA